MLRVPAAEAGRPDRTDVVVAPAQGLDRKARGGRKRSPAPASAGSKRGSRGRRPPCQSAAHGARGGETARRGRHIRFRVRTGAEAARRPAPCCNPSQRPQVCCLFVFDCLFHYFLRRCNRFPQFSAVSPRRCRIGQTGLYLYFLHFGRKCFHTLPRPAAGRTATRHFDRAQSPRRHFDRSGVSRVAACPERSRRGEIRRATEAGRMPEPVASTERRSGFSPSTGSGQATPPRAGPGLRSK